MPIMTTEALIERMKGIPGFILNWFTALFNIRFQVGRMDPGEALLLVKSRQRGIKGNGVKSL